MMGMGVLRAYWQLISCSEGGYGLNGYFSLEEHHARNLQAYYRALAVHPHHNYYEGRSDADLTPWLEYFTGLLAEVFNIVKNEVLRLKDTPLIYEPQEMRRLDHRARVVLGLFARSDTITARQVAQVLGLSERMARNLMIEWVNDEWLVVVDTSRRGRVTGYRQFIGNLELIGNFPGKVKIDALLRGSQPQRFISR